MVLDDAGSHHALGNHRETNSNASQDVNLQQVTAADTGYEATLLVTSGCNKSEKRCYEVSRGSPGNMLVL